MGAPPPPIFHRESHLETLLQLLEGQSRDNAENPAFTLLADDGSESTITYGQLHERALRIAAELACCTQPGDRALLVYPSGLDFIAAFLGCIYSGVLPVPSTYPRPRRPMPRLSAIAADCLPSVALTTGASLKLLDVPAIAPQLASLRWLATDELGAAGADWQRPNTNSDDVAFLQYTSGSTSEPKGVMVSHANLLHNMAMIRHGNNVGDVTARTSVSWLPAYHDMGLI